MVVATLDDRISVDFISSKDIILVVVLSIDDSSRKKKVYKIVTRDYIRHFM